MEIRNHYNAEQRKIAESIVAEITEEAENGPYTVEWLLQNEIGVEEIRANTAGTADELEVSQMRLAILRDLLEDNAPERPTLNSEDSPMSAAERLMCPAYTLYAVYKIDSAHLGKRYASIVRTEPNLSHSEYAIYKLCVEMPIGSEVAVSDAGATIAHVDLYDCTPCPTHDMAWMELAWHIDTHRIHVSSGGVAGDMLKGAHVVSWQEV